MTLNEVNQAITAKMLELEVAKEMGRPDPELLKIYKELKELQYQKVQTELNPEGQGQ